MNKHCPECGIELVQRTLFNNAYNEHIWECNECGMLVKGKDTVDNKVTAAIHGEIRIPFVVTVRDVERDGDWNQTEANITDQVESMFIGDILDEQYGHRKVHNMDGIEVYVREVIED